MKGEPEVALARQIDKASAELAGLHGTTQLPQDRFVDPIEDPDDVIGRVAGHPTRAEDLIQRAVAALHDARTEVEELQTLP